AGFYFRCRPSSSWPSGSSVSSGCWAPTWHGRRTSAGSSSGWSWRRCSDPVCSAGWRDPVVPPTGGGGGKLRFSSYSRIPQVQTLRFAAVNLFTRFVDPGHHARVLDALQPDLMLAVEMAPKAADVIADHFEHQHLVPDPHFMGWGVAGRYDMTADEDVSWLGRGGALRVQLPGTVLHLAAIHLYDPLFGNPIDLARKRRQQV